MFVYHRLFSKFLYYFYFPSYFNFKSVAIIEQAMLILDLHQINIDLNCILYCQIFAWTLIFDINYILRIIFIRFYKNLLNLAQNMVKKGPFIKIFIKSPLGAVWDGTIQSIKILLTGHPSNSRNINLITIWN